MPPAPAQLLAMLLNFWGQGSPFGKLLLGQKGIKAFGIKIMEDNPMPRLFQDVPHLKGQGRVEALGIGMGQQQQNCHVHWSLKACLSNNSLRSSGFKRVTLPVAVDRVGLHYKAQLLLGLLGVLQQDVGGSIFLAYIGAENQYIGVGQIIPLLVADDSGYPVF
jgi:hypothetical protein